MILSLSKDLKLLALFSLLLHVMLFQSVKIVFPVQTAGKPTLNFLGSFLDQRDFAHLTRDIKSPKEDYPVQVRSQKSSFDPRKVTEVAKPSYAAKVKRKSKTYKKTDFLNPAEEEKITSPAVLPPLDVELNPPQRPKLKLSE